MIRWTVAIGLLGALTACVQDYDVYEASKAIYIAPLTDAGGTSVGNWVTVRVPIYSIGRAPVNVTNVTVENQGDADTFVLLTNWKNTDTDGDEVNDILALDGGASDLSVFEMVEISFRPATEGYFRATVYVDTNDNKVADIEPVEGVHDGEGVHVFQLRGIARYPQSSYYPQYLDFGKRAIGGYFSRDVTVTNNGSIMMVVSGYDEASGSSTSFFGVTPTPVYILPGDSEVIEFGYIPAFSTEESAEVTLVTNDPDDAPIITLLGNGCEASSDDSWDADNDGYMTCGLDCNDAYDSIYPDAPETANGRDDDCDGVVDERSDSVSADDDGDGYSENQGDCADDWPDIYPGAEEVPNDQIDNDCDNIIDEDTSRVDDDGDGFSNREGDCADYNVAIGPEMDEDADGVDNDCDGNIDEGTWDFDDDRDGVTENEGDCDDYDAWTFPGADEDCDGIDNDCDNNTDEANEGGGGDSGAEDEGACAYLTETETVTPSTGSCSSSGSGPVGFLAMLALMAGLAFRVRED
ncbi:MAG: choice-of-anchor D domain-containing protein [Alphaproteobacteria bacterium]|nr:choice-of-anchor D domain-containing protein [Alphaproteobacteria bacterium]MCB9793402.1 choice-of-anchor D domain-containing protein [Alphaproteobacteria bacterium]